MSYLLIIITVQSAILRQRINIVVFDLLYHVKHLPTAQDTLGPVLCVLYESGIVRSLCILAVPAHVKESGQKVAVAVQSCTCQRIESSGLTKIMNS